MPDHAEVMQRLARLRVAVRAWQALAPGTDAVIPIGKRGDCAIFRSDLEMLIAEMHRHVMAQTLPPLPPRVDWTDEDVRAYGLACIKAYRQAATVNKKDSA